MLASVVKVNYSITRLVMFERAHPMSEVQVRAKPSKAAHPLPLPIRRRSLSEYLSVLFLRHLLQSVERLSGSHGYKLRSTLLSQAKTFVEARHEANKQTLIKRLDAEKWAQVNTSLSKYFGV